MSRPIALTPVLSSPSVGQKTSAPSTPNSETGAKPAASPGRVLFSRSLPGRTFTGTFFALAIVSLISAVMMITSRNPVYCVLWFALTLLSNSGLYLLQGAEFLAAATIIIYAGAIIVTFLFVIMLAQPTGAAKYDRFSREPFLACVAGALLAALLSASMYQFAALETEGSGVVWQTRPGPLSDLMRLKHGSPPGQDSKLPVALIDSRPTTVDGLPAPASHVHGLGRSLMQEHMVSLQVIGLLLFVAVAGALLIATQKFDSHSPLSSPGP